MFVWNKHILMFRLEELRQYTGYPVNDTCLLGAAVRADSEAFGSDAHSGLPRLFWLFLDQQWCGTESALAVLEFSSTFWTRHSVAPALSGPMPKNTRPRKRASQIIRNVQPDNVRWELNKGDEFDALESQLSEFRLRTNLHSVEARGSLWPLDLALQRGERAKRNRSHSHQMHALGSPARWLPQRHRTSR